MRKKKRTMARDNDLDQKKEGATWEELESFLTELNDWNESYNSTIEREHNE